jgi:hypothetical protein
MDNDNLFFLVGPALQLSQCNWDFGTVMPQSSIYMSYFTRNHFLQIGEDRAENASLSRLPISSVRSHCAFSVPTFK